MALDILQKVGIQDIERNFNAYPMNFLVVCVNV